MVVLNNSSFSALTHARCILLLSKMFRTVYIPKAVEEEFKKMNKSTPSFVEVRELNDEQKERASKMRKRLHGGEREAIILAADLGDLLIIDDRPARKECKKNLNITGSFGVIREAYSDCLLTRTELESAVELLKRDLYYEDWLCDYVLAARKDHDG
jgi:predicted nucleic acid-binding protein